MSLVRNFVSSVRGLHRPRRWAMAGGALLLGLAACGGGDPVSEFEPRRIVVLGDEASLLTDDGRNYSVNGLGAVPAGGGAAPIDCRARRIWVQRLADEYDFGFEECNDDPAGTPQAGFIRAAENAKVGDIAQQVADHERLVGRLGPRDLVTVLVGQHDIIGLYEGIAGSGATSSAQCSAASGPARAIGETLAREINRIASDGSGGRVLFVTVPRQGDTPYGRLSTPDPNRRDCLNLLTDAFNTGLRTDVTNDGRHMALVAIDEQARLIVGDPDRFGYENASEAACLVAPPDCTTDTLEDAAERGDYLWAGDRLFGPELHELLGDLARDRVRNDVPF